MQVIESITAIAAKHENSLTYLWLDDDKSGEISVDERGLLLVRQGIAT